jgi:XrtJ-associated TM-motif-TM protein
MLGEDCGPVSGQQWRGFMKTLTRIAFLGSLFLVPAVLHAQGACVDSPECPTAILGVVGAAGAALYVRWRSR